MTLVFIKTGTLPRVEASKFGELLCNEADRLVDPPFRIAANTDAALGMQGDNRGLLIVPDANLTAEKLKKLDNEVLPLGLLFTHNISPVMADKVIAASQQVAVELIKPDGKVPLHVTHLAATRVAGQLVLLAYTKSSEPPLITTLVEIEETVSAALTVAAHRISEKRGILLLTAFGRYRATIEIADMNEGVPTAPR